MLLRNHGPILVRANTLDVAPVRRSLNVLRNRLRHFDQGGTGM